MIDTILALDNLLLFRKNLFEKIQKVIITNDCKIRDENLQYNINRETAKVSPLSLGKINKYKCLTGEKILPRDQIREKL